MNTTADFASEHHVILVTAPSCHLCEDARSTLTERAQRGVLQLTVVEMESQQGQELISRHRPPLFPLVLLDDQIVCCGRLSRGRLDRALKRAA